MSKKTKQIYIVVKGRQPGIYFKWFGVGEAEEQIKEYPDAIYKGFFTKEEAINWLKEFPLETLNCIAPNLVEFTASENETDNSPSIKEMVNDFLSNGMVVIFTDGCAIRNPGPGGYGVILKYKQYQKELTGGYRNSTNNRMEIYACIAGLKALKQESNVVIISDSKYVVDSISQGWVNQWKAAGWKKRNNENAENSDLWEQLLELTDHHKVDFRWIRGHNNTLENERCDRLAKEYALRNDLPIDIGYPLNQS